MNFYQLPIRIDKQQYLLVYRFLEMSRANKQSQQQPVKPKFDTKPYQKPGLNQSDILEIKEIFDIFDKEHVGSINPKQLKSAISSLGSQARNEPIYQLILELDSEGAGNITFEQFIHLLTPRILEDDTRENIGHIFSLFDTEKTGFISVKDLRRIAHEIGQELSEQDFNDMIRRADQDKDGVISKDQFYELIRTKA